MTTTLEKYQGHRALNYSTNPTIDVEVLDPNRARRCRTCDNPVEWDPDAGSWGRWVHVEAVTTDTKHWIDPHMRCRYCGVDGPDQVKFRQHAWYDATECSRCGGVDGRAIGD